MIGDPLFQGFLGQRYQVHGLDGAVYAVLSQASVSINARFVFLDSGVCPVLEGVTLSNCWSHPGSYFGELAIQTEAGDQLELVAGPAALGFSEVRLQQQSVSLSRGSTLTGRMLNVTVLSSHSLSITVDNYRLLVDNSDRFVNLLSVEVLNWHRLVAVDQPHGLLGQTWQPLRRERRGDGVLSAAQVTEGSVDDYTIAGDQLLGTDFLFNKFQTQ